MLVETGQGSEVGRHDLADNEVERNASCFGDVTDDVADRLGDPDIEGVPGTEVGPPAELLRSRHRATLPLGFAKNPQAVSACRARSVESDAAVDASGAAFVEAAGERFPDEQGEDPGSRGVAADGDGGPGVQEEPGYGEGGAGGKEDGAEGSGALRGWPLSPPAADGELAGPKRGEGEEYGGAEDSAEPRGHGASFAGSGMG